MSNEDHAIIGSGHNRSPFDLLFIQDELSDEFRDLEQRRNDLIAAESRMPDITDDDIAGRATDFIRQIMAMTKASDSSRIAKKEPYLSSGRAVDGFFQKLIDPALAVKKRVESKLTLYLRMKEAEERSRRQEAERLAREEAERAAREAAEAEAKLQSERDLPQAIEAERRAETAVAASIAATKQAEAKPAEMSRVRGEYGGLSSLKEVWEFEAIDRAALDLEMLRSHIPMAALETAVRSFIKAGGRVLRGTQIVKTTKAVAHG